MPIFKRAEAVRTRAALNATAADLSSATTPEARQEVLRRHGVTDVPEGEGEGVRGRTAAGGPARIAEDSRPGARFPVHYGRRAGKTIAPRPARAEELIHIRRPPRPQVHAGT